MTRRPFFVGLATVLAIVTTALGVQATFDAQKQSEPPHAARSTASVQTGPLPLAAVGGEQPQDVIGWLDGLARAEWFAGVERAAQEAEMAATAAARDLRQRVPGTPTSAPGDCDGVPWVIPVGKVIDESGCRFDAVNPTGCSGYTCVGAYQFDARHWDASSGWGGCADLGDWSVPENQHECARRLSGDGTNLAPWGG